MTTETNRIIVAVLGNSFSLLLSRLLGLAFAISGARFLPVEDFGVLLTAIATMSLIAALVSFGLPNALTHYTVIAKKNDSSLQLSNLLIVTGLLSFGVVVPLLAILYFSAGWFVSKNSPIFTCFLAIVFGAYFLSLSRIATGYLRGFKRTVIASIIDDPSVKLLQLLCIVVLVVFGISIEFLLYILSTLYLIRCALSLFVLGQSPWSDFRKPMRLPIFDGKFFKYCSNSWTVTVLQTIRSRADVIIVAVALSYTAVPHFVMGATVASLFLIVSTSLNPAIRPLTTALSHSQQNNELRRLYSHATRRVMIVSVPLLLFLFFNAMEMVGLFFGVEYVASNIVTQIILIGFIPTIFSGPANTLLLSLGRTKDIRNVEIVAALVFVLTALCMILLGAGLVGIAIVYSFAWALETSLKANKVTDIIDFKNIYRVNDCCYVLALVAVSLLCSQFNATVGFSNLVLDSVMILVASLFFACITKVISLQEILMLAKPFSSYLRHLLWRRSYES